jgi:hypothetical protein
MKIWSFRTIELAFALMLSAALATPQDVLAQNHVVDEADLQRDVAAAAAAREQNIAQLRSFLSSEEAAHAMKTAHLNYRQVENAIPRLSDSDLAMLSARSQNAQKDFAAGSMSDRDLLVILVAIAALILIIVAVRN